MSDNQLVQRHNRTSKPKDAWVIKAKVIERFGTIKAAAKKLKVHRNSIRLAWQGRCPDVLTRLLEETNGR